jgi:predicted permease
MMTLLDWIARRLIRLNGVTFAATYGDDLLATLRARGELARSRGTRRFITFVGRELGALAWSAVRQRQPRWEPVHTFSARRAMSPEAVGRELRRAARRLASTPGFTAAAVFTLGLAIAATTSVFSLVSSIVLAALPYPASERLIDLDHAAPALGLPSGMGTSIGLARDYDALPSIEDVALYTVQAGTLADGLAARRAMFLQATPSLGATLGLRTQLGRWFTDSEGVPGGPNVVVLTDATWRRDFGASPSIVGQTLRMEGSPYDIVGVLAPGSVFPDTRVEFMRPLPLPPTWPRATGFNYSGIARIAPGATIEQARREQRAAIDSVVARYPADAEIGVMVEGGLRPVTRPLKDTIVGEVTTTLLALLGAAAIVLLMACANLANLFLVRYESRRREVMVQRSLGAGAIDVMLQVLGETVLVSAAGAAFGLTLAHATINAIVRWGPQDLPRLQEVHLGSTDILFAAATSGLVAVFIALLPLLHLSTRDRTSVANSERGGTPPPARMAARHTLMVAQIALAVVVTVAAGLLTRSFANVLRVDPGFRAESRLVFDSSLPRAEYRTRAEAALFHSTVLDRLRSLPDVAAAAATTNLPLEGVGIGDPLEVHGRPVPSAEVAPIVRYRRVSQGYFTTLGIPLRAGRLFDAMDGDGTTASAIVDEATAMLYFSRDNPIGKQIRPRDSDAGDRWLTIVGVVGNTATATLTETSAVPKLYVPLRGSMWADVPTPHNVSYIVRTKGDPVAQVAAVRRVLTETNPRIALARPERLEDVMIRARAPRALTMILLVISALMAIVVGTIGVYAVMEYAVAQRSVEIGVRLALGATPSQVTALIVRSGAAVVGIGVAAGLVMTMALASLLESLLFGVAPLDWPTRIAVAVSISVVGMAASWWPAMRASHRDPLRALRPTA